MTQHKDIMISKLTENDIKNMNVFVDDSRNKYESIGDFKANIYCYCRILKNEDNEETKTYPVRLVIQDCRRLIDDIFFVFIVFENRIYSIIKPLRSKRIERKRRGKYDNKKDNLSSITFKIDSQITSNSKIENGLCKVYLFKYIGNEVNDKLKIIIDDFRNKGLKFSELGVNDIISNNKIISFFREHFKENKSCFVIEDKEKMFESFLIEKKDEKNSENSISFINQINETFENLWREDNEYISLNFEESSISSVKEILKQKLIDCFSKDKINQIIEGSFKKILYEMQKPDEKMIRKIKMEKYGSIFIGEDQINDKKLSNFCREYNIDKQKIASILISNDIWFFMNDKIIDLKNEGFFSFYKEQNIITQKILDFIREKSQNK